MHVTPPEPASSVAAACAHLVNYLPSKLDGHRSRVVSPRSPLTHAWGSPPIVMRCGVARPSTFSRSSPQTARVDGVVWYQEIGADTVTWTAIRRTADVELAVPTSYEGQGGFLVELGKSLRAAVP